MVLLDDILVWSQGSLKPWQQDAVRRLFQGTLNSDGLADLYAMLKSSVGLEDPKKRVPDPLSKNHLPATAGATDKVALLTMRDVEHVNMLAPKQTLKFSQTGLTVIYGGNGSGKSGYARVLKRACRSRDESEEVIPNAREKGSASKVPSALFDVEIAGNALEVKWEKNKAAPPEMASIAVFDTRCARAYIDDQQEVAYLPFGLDVVENLGQTVFPKLTETLEAEIKQTDTTTDAFRHLFGNTKVGTLITGLNAKTTEAEVTSLSKLSQEETERAAELKKTLNETNPKAKADALKLAAARMASFDAKIKKAHSLVKDEVIPALKTIDDDAQVAIAAEEKAADVLRAGESLLPGTGDEVWKILYEAARNFSSEKAYPEHPFPHTGDKSQCVLCQQDVQADGAARLARFEAFVQADTAKTAKEKRERRASAEQRISQFAVKLEVEDALLEEIEKLDAGLTTEIAAYSAALETRKEWMLAVLKSHKWEGISALPVDPCIRLKAVSDKLLAEKATYEKAGDEAKRAALQKELAELEARIALTPHEKAVLALVKRIQTKAMLLKCRDQLQTKPISTKSKELASNAVTEPLRAALAKEFKALGVVMAAPRLEEKVVKGKIQHKLALDLAVGADIRDILSEGEQRAIAIGSFLAELSSGGHGGGIVFDDPVSSLDHFRRQAVARRLVEEAANRQVIIFTHDTAFLGELQDYIEHASVSHVIHHLEWHGKDAGKINEGLPWHQKSFKDRIHHLEQAQNKIAKVWPQYPNDDEIARMRQLYSNLRATLERFIQDVIFAGVVVRYRDWIKVGNLKDAVGFTHAEFLEVDRIHSICSNATEAHDASGAKNPSVPTPADLAKAIADLVSLSEGIKVRQKAQSSTLGIAGLPAASPLTSMPLTPITATAAPPASNTSVAPTPTVQAGVASAASSGKGKP
ncbi:MAG TPA: AAA family ATPase [Burkholderiales bacterium]|jgi:energy-coupling factor transporter ATP-binding protein EcfA2